MTNSFVLAHFHVYMASVPLTVSSKYVHHFYNLLSSIPPNSSLVHYHMKARYNAITLY